MSLATVRRLDRIVAAARSRGGAEPGALVSYGRIIVWASCVATEYGTVPQWVHACRDEVHAEATAGALVLVDVDSHAVRVLGAALAAAPPIVTYTPTYSTAVGWMLDVAHAVGHPPPGEEPDEE
jgi:hypothetical protein